MKVTSGLFMGGIIFFGALSAIYAFFSGSEPVGTVALLLLAVMSAMIAFYLRASYKRLEPDPADSPRGDIAESAGDYGFFSPHSWWPLALGFSGFLLFLGVALGWWIFVIGAVAGTLTLIGWTFEYFRGDVI